MVQTQTENLIYLKRSSEAPSANASADGRLRFLERSLEYFIRSERMRNVKRSGKSKDEIKKEFRGVRLGSSKDTSLRELRRSLVSQNPFAGRGVGPCEAGRKNPSSRPVERGRLNPFFNFVHCYLSAERPREAKGF